MDEPTVAVDPQSRNNILEGIQTLRKNGATVVYTTHYMEEVEIICDRVIILDKGKIIASGSCDELKELTGIEEKVTVETQSADDELVKSVYALGNVDSASCSSGVFTVTYKNGKNNLPALIDFLREKNIPYNRIYSERPTLNDVFLELTGKELRD